MAYIGDITTGRRQVYNILDRRAIGSLGGDVKPAGVVSEITWLLVAGIAGYVLWPLIPALSRKVAKLSSKI